VSTTEFEIPLRTAGAAFHPGSGSCRPLDRRSRGVVVLGLQPIGHSNDTARRTNHWGGNRSSAGPDAAATRATAIRPSYSGIGMPLNPEQAEHPRTTGQIGGEHYGGSNSRGPV
jgi:hypothetical protein